MTCFVVCTRRRDLLCSVTDQLIAAKFSLCTKMDFNAASGIALDSAQVCVICTNNTQEENENRKQVYDRKMSHSRHFCTNSSPSTELKVDFVVNIVA